MFLIGYNRSKDIKKYFTRIKKEEKYAMVPFYFRK